jgi:hypothetical protein
MGHTHYWEVKATADPANYRKALAGIRKVVRASPVPLGGPDGNGKPVLKGEICFNGASPEDFETFHLPGSPERGIHNLCKTGFTYIRKYDAIVTACLCILAECMGEDARVTSDGGEEDWTEGVKLASKVLDRPVPIPTPVKAG